MYIQLQNPLYGQINIEMLSNMQHFNYLNKWTWIYFAKYMISVNVFINYMIHECIEFRINQLLKHHSVKFSQIVFIGIYVSSSIHLAFLDEDEPCSLCSAPAFMRVYSWSAGPISYEIVDNLS